MLTALTTAGQHEAMRLTHRQCITAGSQQPAGRAKSASPWVQVRRYHPTGSFVICGRVVELRENGAEWFKVDTSMGPVWADGAHLRLCSGDRRCTCEPAASIEDTPC